MKTVELTPGTIAYDEAGPPTGGPSSASTASSWPGICGRGWRSGSPSGGCA
jgi:hypothetical protein